MPTKKREELYDLFATGNKPTQDDFIDLIDSMINIAEDGIGSAEKGKPMEIIEKGTARRLLDFSSAPDTPIWRLSAQSGEDALAGLNFVSGNRSRLFISQSSGYLGINNDDPGAKLHVTPDAGPSLRIDDLDGSPALMMGLNGNMGLGQVPDDSYRLLVSGNIMADGSLTVTGTVNAGQGLSVTGALLAADRGLRVRNGATIETGQLAANGGLLVNGSALEARAGAVVRGLALEAVNGARINGGLSVETGLFEARGGGMVSGGLLEVQNGINVRGGVTLNGAIEASTLNVSSGLTLGTGAILNASGSVSLGNSDQGTVTVNGSMTANAGLVVNNRPLRALGGAEIRGGALELPEGLNVTGGQSGIRGTLNVNDLLVVTSTTIEATGPVTLGRDPSHTVTVGGLLTAGGGLTVSGGTLLASTGALVQGAPLDVRDGIVAANGVTVNSGILNAMGGITIPGGAALDAGGNVNLGAFDNGTVTLRGQLIANKGAVIGGGTTTVQGKLEVSGTLEVPLQANINKAVVENLTANNLNISGDIGLTSVDLEMLEARDASIDNMKTLHTFEGDGELYSLGNAVLGGGKIIAFYRGPAADSPEITLAPGTLSGDTHFQFQVDPGKKMTITYDDHSDISCFQSDWENFKTDNPGAGEGFSFNLQGAGALKMKAEVAAFQSSGAFFKIFNLSSIGIEVIYDGSLSGTPHVDFMRNSNHGERNFQFSLDGLHLTITFPRAAENSTASRLITQWESWKRFNSEVAGDFHMQQKHDSPWPLEDVSTAADLNPTGEVVLEYSIGGIIIQKTGIQNTLYEINLNAPRPASAPGVDITTSEGDITINLGTEENSPLDVYNAFKRFVESGNVSNGFEVMETSSTTPVNVSLDETLSSLTEEFSQKTIGGVIVSFQGEKPETARVLVVPSGNNEFSVNINEAEKTLTINYPSASANRYVAPLLSVWEGIEEKYGFDILEDLNNSSGEFIISKVASFDLQVGETKEYVTSTRGVDKVTVKYTGPVSDTPRLVLRANNTNAFNITIDGNKLITILYPADNSGSVPDLMAFWAGFPGKDSFSLQAYDISTAAIPEASGDLAENGESYLLNRCVLRTSEVRVDGYLRFGSGEVVIEAFSADQTLGENSDWIIPTQGAVKAYADTKADKSLTEQALAAKANQSDVNQALQTKANQSDMDQALAAKANQSDVNQALQTKANQSDMDQALAVKANQSDMDQALAAKAGYQSLASFSIEGNTSNPVEDLVLAPQSRGMLMVQADGIDFSTAGFYSVMGESSVVKIAGEVMGGAPGADQYNIYYDDVEEKIIIENNTPDAITVSLTYWGS